MNPSVFFKIKVSHFMGQIAVSIWPDFQGDWDPTPSQYLQWSKCFNMTRFSRGLRLRTAFFRHNDVLITSFNMTRFSRGLRPKFGHFSNIFYCVSIWPDFQGDWDISNKLIIVIESVSIWPDFQGDWDSDQNPIRLPSFFVSIWPD